MNSIFTFLRIGFITNIILLLATVVNAQNLFLEAPAIKNYGGNKLVSPVNYMGQVLPNNDLLFANKNGVLKYDGTQWSIIPIKDSLDVISILYKDDIIYVGSDNEFGYLKSKMDGEYEYVSFKSYYNRREKTDKFFQIVAVGEDIYFQTDGTIFRWDGSAMHSIPLKAAYIFNLEGTLYASAFDEGIAIIENDEVKFVNHSFKFKEDAAFNIIKEPSANEYKIYTGENGIYYFNSTNYTTQPIKSQVSTLLKKDGYYSGVKFLDSLQVASTWDGGIVIFNNNGDVLSFIDKSKGITGKFLREVFVDHRNKIWVTSDVGISEIYWQKFDTLSIALTKLNEFRVEDKDRLNSDKMDSSIVENASILFNFSTPGFNQDEVEYSHKLQGGNGTWSKWEPYHIREYTQLKGGDYTFSVKSRTITGIETQPISVSFKVHIPWHKTITAYILYFLGVLLILGLITWARTLKLNITNKRLEHIVNKRTKELLDKSEDLEASNKELRTKNFELDQFVYRSSHDLIAPLKSLKGLIYIAKSEDPGKSQTEYLDHMETSVIKLEDFINSIIDFTTNVNTPRKLIDVDINGVLDEIINELKYFGDAEKVTLTRQLDLPNIQCDPKRLKIVMSNLITNCLKYHNYDQPNPFINVKAYKKNSQVIIEVEDNGLGIKPELLNNIFDMFFRASDKSEGSGLGLYIVKDTVAKIGGVINVSSKYGKGTTFSIILNNE